jgi:hypothetical protein
MIGGTDDMRKGRDKTRHSDPEQALDAAIAFVKRPEKEV